MRASPTLRTFLAGGATLFAAASGFVACGGDSRQATRDSVVAIAIPPRPAVAGSPGCPSDGRWTPCALVDRVSRSGLVFKAAGDTVRAPFLGAPGVRYKVGSVATLVAFIYPDSMALERDWRMLDTLRLTAKGDTAGPWPSRPFVVRSANLLVAMFDGSETQTERVGLAITAGAPAPSRPESPTVLPVIPNEPKAESRTPKADSVRR